MLLSALQHSRLPGTPRTAHFRSRLNVPRRGAGLAFLSTVLWPAWRSSAQSQWRRLPWRMDLSGAGRSVKPRAQSWPLAGAGGGGRGIRRGCAPQLARTIDPMGPRLWTRLVLSTYRALHCWQACLQPMDSVKLQSAKDHCLVRWSRHLCASRQAALDRLPFHMPQQPGLAQPWAMPTVEAVGTHRRVLGNAALLPTVIVAQAMKRGSAESYVSTERHWWYGLAILMGALYLGAACTTMTLERRLRCWPI